jgi:cation diffusion facilitator family transporter
VESVRTIIVAGLANLAIAVAKAITGLLSGSAAMLSEAAHSFADTTTEVLLFVAVRRGARPADERFNFGYGRAGFLWALLAAGFTFVIGGGFAITHGVHTIIDGEVDSHVGPSFAVLAIAFALESVSLTQGIRQARREALRFRVGLRRYLRGTANTAVRAVVLEDLAALAGLVIAALGLGMTVLTGSSVWDGGASIAIGVLLIGAAASLVRANASLLIGQAVPAQVQSQIRAELETLPEIEEVDQLFTSIIGMSDLLVAARVKFTYAATGEAITAAADEAERRLSQTFPNVRYVFLDPTSL